jgi:hypothetical protein
MRVEQGTCMQQLLPAMPRVCGGFAASVPTKGPLSGKSMHSGQFARGVEAQVCVGVALGDRFSEGRCSTATDRSGSFCDIAPSKLRAAGIRHPGTRASIYSTVTDLARFRGLSTSVPRAHAV